ncbi:hypothetical protein EDD16DRAFT_1472464, partial [Pisolithus croceorrhizus]
TCKVPVMVLLTKGDSLELNAIEQLEDVGIEIEEAPERIVEKQRELLEKCLEHIKYDLDKCKYPPRRYNLLLADMHEENADCTTLIQSTTSVLNTEDLQKLLIPTQQSNIVLCINHAVKK